MLMHICPSLSTKISDGQMWIDMEENKSLRPPTYPPYFHYHSHLHLPPQVPALYMCYHLMLQQ